MIISTHQPYFLPYPGFFYKAHLSDIFVVLDTVQFPRGTTWISRNRFKNDQGTLWLTVPVWKKGLGLQRIDEVRVCHEFRWVAKHLQSLKTAYARAPYLGDHLPFIEKIYGTGFEKLIEFNMAFIHYLFQQLKIETEIKLLSELGIQATGNRMLVEICRCLGASVYLAQAAAAKYLDRALFQQEGIKLQLIKPTACVYPQLWGTFVSNLSACDLLFNCGPKAHDILTARLTE
ncbi:MAG: WbqC family protein [Desulfobacterales bacterium]